MHPRTIRIQIILSDEKWGARWNRHLSRQIARYHAFARTPEIVACIRSGDNSSTTDYANLIQQNRQSREKCLDMPGVFGRLRSSARASQDRPAYWHGRIVYYYLASIRWNLKQKHLNKAVSRSTYTLLALLSSGRNLVSNEFWRGIRKPHYNLVRTTIEAMGADLYPNTVWRD